MQQRITTNLWFDTEAEEAADFYVSVFKNSRIVSVANYTDAGPRPADMVMVVEFELDGQRFVGINGGPEFKFDEAMSLQVNCEDQDEIDYYWERLTDGRPGRAVRLAEGPLRRVLAGHADRHGRALRRPGQGAGRARDAGDVRNEEDRHRRPGGRSRRRPVAPAAS